MDKPKPIHFTINGEKWRIEIEDRPGLWGECSYVEQRITLHSVLKNSTRKRLEILIHEVIHACFPKATEEAVEQAGRVIAGICWSDGWRRTMARDKSGRKRRPRSM